MIALTGLVLEGLVAVLLIVTIFYCVILDRRIRSFKAEQINLAELVAQLSSATANAEVAVAGLKITTEEADDELDGKLKKARSLSEELAFMVETGNNLAGKLAEPSLRGLGDRHEAVADNVAYLKMPKKRPVALQKTEPAFSNPVSHQPERTAAATDKGGEAPYEPKEPSTHDQFKTNQEYQPVHSMNTQPYPDQMRRQAFQAPARPDRKSSADREFPDRGGRQTLAQALRYAR